VGKKFQKACFLVRLVEEEEEEEEEHKSICEKNKGFWKIRPKEQKVLLPASFKR
jgi:hypothetical protein